MCARGRTTGGRGARTVFRHSYFRSHVERAKENPRYMWSERAAPWSCARRKPRPDRARSVSTLGRNPITGKRGAGSARATVRARARHSVLSRQKEEPEENPKEPDLEKRAVDAYLVSRVCLNARDGFGDVPRAVLSHSFTSKFVLTVQRGAVGRVRLCRRGCWELLFEASGPNSYAA